MIRALSPVRRIPRGAWIAPLAFAGAAIPALSATAAPATPEEAVRLTALFERYVGHPAAGEPSSVTVEPKGEGYTVTLDVKRATAGLGALGFTLDPYTSAVTLTPLPDGTWKVTSHDSPPMLLHAGAQTVTSGSATAAFEGVFDPKLRAFSSFKGEQTGYTYAQTTPTSVQNRRADRIDSTGIGAAAEGGTVSTGIHYALTGTAGDVVFRLAPVAPAPGDPPVPPPQPGTALSYAAPTGSVDVSLERTRVDGLLDLWAFFVAHPTHDGIVAAQDELKATLRAGLPFLDGLREAAAFDTVAVTTPIGVVSMKSFAGGLDLAGLAATGKATGALSMTDLVIPSGPLPAWSAGLVPTGLDLHVAVDGFHAAEAAVAAVDDLDLRHDVVITPEQKEAVSHAFWPGGGTVALLPSRVTTKLLDLRMEGQATMAPKPSGRFTVRGKGLDAEIAALQAQAGTDPAAGQVLGPLVLAKNLAKPDPDGGLVWVIEFGDGPVKINGATLQ